MSQTQAFASLVFICVACKAEFPSTKDRLNHYKTCTKHREYWNERLKHPKVPFIRFRCDFCGVGFTSHGSFKKHSNQCERDHSRPFTGHYRNVGGQIWIEAYEPNPGLRQYFTEDEIQTLIKRQRKIIELGKFPN
jgi:hypothetical protein